MAWEDWEDSGEGGVNWHFLCRLNFVKKKEKKLMMHFFIAAMLLAVSASGFAFNSDECDSEIDKDVEMAASNKDV
jgi:hypothetical protein